MKPSGKFSFLLLLFCRADCIAGLIMFGRVLAPGSQGRLLALLSQYHGLAISRKQLQFRCLQAGSSLWPRVAPPEITPHYHIRPFGLLRDILWCITPDAGKENLGSTLACGPKQIHTGRSMVIQSAHIQYRVVFVWPPFARKLLASRVGLHEPGICPSLNPGKKERSSWSYIALIFAASVREKKKKPSRAPGGWLPAAPGQRKQKRIQHILVIAGSGTGHDGTADLMVTDGALRRPRSCLLTGHKRYTRNTVSPPPHHHQLSTQLPLQSLQTPPSRPLQDVRITENLLRWSSRPGKGF